MAMALIPSTATPNQRASWLPASTPAAASSDDLSVRRLAEDEHQRAGLDTRQLQDFYQEAVFERGQAVHVMPER